jgi:hypothetical protein
MRMTQRKLSIITAGTSIGSNGPVRENPRHLTHLDDANLAPCAINGGFKFPRQRQADMRMEAVTDSRTREAQIAATASSEFPLFGSVVSPDGQFTVCNTDT